VSLFFLLPRVFPSLVTLSALFCHLLPPLCLYFATLESFFLSSFFPNLATFVSFFCHPFFPILLPFEPLWSPFCHPRVLLLSHPLSQLCPCFTTLASLFCYYSCGFFFVTLLSPFHPFVPFILVKAFFFENIGVLGSPNFNFCKFQIVVGLNLNQSPHVSCIQTHG